MAVQLEAQEIAAEEARKPVALNETKQSLKKLARVADEVTYTSELETLTAPQLEVVKYAVEGKHIMLTGVGGGGKSYTVEIVRHVCDAFALPYIVVGSTGTSVMNVAGDGTINSVFGLGLGFEKTESKQCSEYEEYFLIKQNVARSRFFTNAKKVKSSILVIVDEVSMVDNRFLHIIQDAAEENNVKIQWLLVGDPMQFLPVKGSLYFKTVDIASKKTNSGIKQENFLDRLDFVTVNLKRNIRADGDKAWVDCLNDLRLDRMQLNGVNGNLIKERFDYSIANKAPEDAIHLYFNNVGVKRHNAVKTKEMIAKGAESRVYKAQVTGKYDGWHLRKSYDGEKTEYITVFNPIEEEMTFCVGMPVMIRKNITTSFGKLIAANGSVGIVTKLGRTYIEVELDCNGKVVTVDTAAFEGSKNDKGEPIGTFWQIPAHPCFALTFFKCQGLTIDRPGVIHAYYISLEKVKPIPPSHPASIYVPTSRFTSAALVHFATECAFNKDLTPKQMWKLLENSYHTSEEALEWVEAIS